MHRSGVNTCDIIFQHVAIAALFSESHALSSERRDFFHSCCHQQARCRWPISCTNTTVKFYREISGECAKEVMCFQVLAPSLWSFCQIQIEIRQSRFPWFANFPLGVWFLDKMTSLILPLWHLQQISCSILSFHCAVSDVQGETDCEPHTVFPFAWSCQAAGAVHVTGSICNVACLYKHETSEEVDWVC